MPTQNLKKPDCEQPLYGNMIGYFYGATKYPQMIDLNDGGYMETIKTSDQREPTDEL